MTSQALQFKSISVENDPADPLPTTSPIEALQRKIEYNEKVFLGSMANVRVTVENSIDDIRTLMDQKRPESKVYPITLCDLWLRLKSIQLLEPPKLVTLLNMHQAHRAQDQAWKAHVEQIGNDQSFLTNPRKSRVFHCHITKDSDLFDRKTQSYVGLMMFSYEHQLKFKLNGHHCQRGDILIKKTASFNSNHSARRGIYDTLFKSFSTRSIDERFAGIGFSCINGQWRFDNLVHDHQQFLPFEYRILDMFLLTHWLTSERVPCHVQEMESQVKDLISREFQSVKNHLAEQHSIIESSNLWNELTGDDNNDASEAIDQFNQTTQKEIELIFKAMTRRKNSSAQTT